MTAVEWLKRNINLFDLSTDKKLEILTIINQALEMEKQQEISDEEIEKQSELIKLGIHKMFFKTGAKWYREQLKQRK